MINKKIFTFVGMFLLITIHAQTFTGIYNFKFNTSVPSQTFNTVVSSQNKTWFFQTKLETLAKHDFKKETNNGVTTEHISDDYKNVIPASKPEYYKDLNSNHLFSRNFYITKSCYIQEDLDQFDWKFVDEMIDYKDKKYAAATTEFRGKNWIVYFDTNIAFNVAPWKFSGLPGVVVYAKTMDNLYEFELQEYKVTANTTELKNPFEKEKFISWEIYKTEYKNYLQNLIKKWSADSEDGDGGSIKMGDMIEDLGFSEVK